MDHYRPKRFLTKSRAYRVLGNCRFGENCKYEHQVNDGLQQHSSIMKQPNFTANVSTTNIDINTLIRAVTNDMMAAEKGGQWLLSCYAPFKEKPNYPGFDEQSFEEIRWGYYEAQRTGTADLYRQQLQMSLQAAASKIRSLQNPSQEAVNTIKNIYNSSPSNPANVYANSAANSNFNNTPLNPFGNLQSTLLTNTNNAGSIFGQPTAFGNPNVFGQSNQQQTASAKSLFSAANQKLFSNGQVSGSVFGNNQLGNVPNQSIFGNPQQNGNFSGASPFAQPFTNQQQASTFPFPVQQNQQSASLFNVQQPFGQQQTGTTSFSPQQALSAQQNTSVFNIQPQGNSPLLGSQQSATTPFGLKQSENIPYGAQQNSNQPSGTMPFGIQQGALPFAMPHQGVPMVVPFNNPTNIFSGNLQPTQAATSQVPHTSIFGSPNATLGNATQKVADESIYSKLEELSEAEIKSYESDSFEFGKIPEKPPTIQMCF